MDLDALLKKTAHRSKKIRSHRPPPGIATDDRPYINDLAQRKDDLELIATKCPWEDLTPEQAGLEAPLPSALIEVNAKPVTEPVTEPVTVNAEPVTEPVTVNAKPVTEPVTINTKPVTGKSGSFIKPVTEPVTTGSGTRNEPVTEPVTEISLVQLQRKVLFYVYDRCCQIGSLTSPFISKEEMRESCKANTGSLRGIILKLEKRGYLRRLAFKNGVSGGVKFQIPERIFQALVLLRTRNEPVTNQEKPVTEPVTEPVTPPSSSSSSLRSYRKEELPTTSDPSNEGALESVWQIDCSVLADIRFGRTQVVQIARDGRLTAEELQESIYAFAFDLSVNEKAKNIVGVPLNYFMGILRRGPYIPSANYENPELRQRRLYLEAMEQQRKKRQDVEERLEALEFDGWLAKLSLEQLAALVPPKDYVKPGGPAHTSQLRNYFRESVWPQISKEGFEKGVTHE